MKPVSVYAFLTATLLCLSSCKTILLRQLLKDPEVETAASIRRFQEEHGFSTKNSFILKGDTSNIQLNFFEGLNSGYQVFDHAGRPLCYKGTSTCTGTQFFSFLRSATESFSICMDTLKTFQQVLKGIVALDGSQPRLEDFPSADYFVVFRWQKFFGGKKGYADTVEWMEEAAAKDTTGKQIVFLKINTDLQESWGLVAGQKAKLKVKREGEGGRILITDLPLTHAK